MCCEAMEPVIALSRGKDSDNKQAGAQKAGAEVAAPTV